MNAGTLNCPSCGAAAPADATECAFCHAKLATIGCPSCFGLVFAGAKFCDHCGAKIASAVDQGGEAHKCPRGCGAMKRVTLGDVQLDECPQCNGLWLDPETFDHLCAKRDQSASALFGAAPATASGGAAHAPPATETVRYVPCPICAKLMNRTNFARVSGVIIDTCKPHGVWFDADELRRVLEFVQGGGLDAARKREIDALAEERRLRDFQNSSLGQRSVDDMFAEKNEKEFGSKSLLDGFAKLMLG